MINILRPTVRYTHPHRNTHPHAHYFKSRRVRQKLMTLGGKKRLPKRYWQGWRCITVSRLLVPEHMKPWVRAPAQYKPGKMEFAYNPALKRRKPGYHKFIVILSHTHSSRPALGYMSPFMKSSCEESTVKKKITLEKDKRWKQSEDKQNYFEKET